MKDGVRGFLHGQRSTLAEQVREIVPIEVLEHHVRRPVLECSDVENTRHVLAPKTNRGARLAYEASHIGLTSGPEHELDCDELIEREMPRRDDDPHASGAEHTLDTVLVEEDLPGLKGGLWKQCRRRSDACIILVARSQPARSMRSGSYAVPCEGSTGSSRHPRRP